MAYGWSMGSHGQKYKPRPIHAQPMGAHGKPCSAHGFEIGWAWFARPGSQRLGVVLVGFNVNGVVF